ncbi:hypothetical protein CFC21_039032 [Triticum aestivum]|uniref:Uncharacterized protein n=2 Tax=Triticum aestivum TaxID=4565 RepID=D8L9U7_WHEAT|nr:uncharacterized protein LOC119280491 [Triticum dicoccoides]XP_044343764.1 uncharacterized protein LOC123064332 [Triticum aestivum]KAF7026951.1 hypothetical protein CFC21_039032 [Triticum aestivum]CBH32659.1 conserved hypothetical protein [Triticum aestivum]CDM83263.1 unnamed protein product [Triticum aestivum]
MGNKPACMSLAPAAGSASASASSGGGGCKVIHADGRVTRLARPVRASELMLDHPGKFVCDACRLAVGCRVPGVAADELLQPRRAYFLLPMDMLYSVLTDDEMAALAAASHGAATAATAAWRRIVVTTTRRRRGGGRGASSRQSNGDAGRVFPVVGLLQLQDAPAGHPTIGVKPSGAGVGLRRLRSWRPVLDTIEEAP